MKKNAIIFITSVIVTCLIVRLGGKPFNHSIKFVANFIYGISLLFILHKYFPKSKIAFVLAVLPVTVFSILIFNSTGWRFFQLATPSTLSFYIGLLLSAVTFRKKITRYLLILAILFNSWVLIEGYDYWTHKLVYKTFTGEQSIPIDKVIFQDKFKNDFTLKDKDEIYVLDFWNTSCAVCFQEFPELEKLFKKHKKDKAISILSVNVPYKDEIYTENEELIRSKKYSFPVLFYTDSQNKLRDKLKVYNYPTTLIIKNNEIIHIGNIFSVKKRLKHLKS